MLINLDDRRIYFDLMGPKDGPVVCFSHSLSSDSGMWAEQVPELLAAGYRVLRLDMRGHGGSDPVAGDYTMEALAGDVRAALDALSIGKVHFIGLSIGGMIGQAFAIHHPGHVASLMLCDTMPATPDGAENAWGPRLEAVALAKGPARLRRWRTARPDPFNRRR